MLTLSRKRGERITLVIPPSDKPQIVELCASYIRGDRAGFGIQAEKTVRIVRNEILDPDYSEDEENESDRE